MIWKYTDSSNRVVFKNNEDGSCESHLAEVITDWIAEGNTPEPADIPPLVIPTLSMRQARLALLAEGLLDDVEASIILPEHRIWWEYSSTVERDNPLVDIVLRALDKTPTQINAMFIAAALL